MITLIEDQTQKDQTIKSKNILKVKGKDPGSRGPGPKPQKRGGPGGVPKIAKFCTRGGENPGGGFLGGSRKTGIIKHEVL